MSRNKLIRNEIDRAPEESLDELYQLVRSFNAARCGAGSRPGALARLRRTQIDALEDFASSLDRYVSGELAVERRNWGSLARCMQR
jgi:hypothetical protein